MISHPNSVNPVNSSAPRLLVGLTYLLLIATVTFEAAGQGVQPAAEERPLHSSTMADAVEMTRVADLLPGGEIAHYSPDGKKVLIVVRKGNLAQNTNEYSLLLWHTNDLAHSPTVETLLTLSSSSNREAIKEITWLEDNESVAFLGEVPGELQQLYIFKHRTRQLRRISNHPTNLVSYSTTPKGDRIAYSAEEPAESFFDGKALREGLVISTQRLPELVADKRSGRATGNDQLFIQSVKSGKRQLTIPDKISYYNPRPLLSPDGRYIAILTQIGNMPEPWKQYSNPLIREWSRQVLGAGQHSVLQRYVIVDADTGQSKPLLDSPVGINGSKLLWSRDSQSVVISDVYLPLSTVEGEELEARRSGTYLVEVAIRTGALTKIMLSDTVPVAWEANTSRQLIRLGAINSALTSTPTVFFERTGSKWEKVEYEESADRLPEVVVNEDMNTPPKIWLIDPRSHRKAMLLDLNPQFSTLRFGKVEEVRWKGSDGHDAKGGLYYPVEYVPGKKYPLVIQTHGWNPNKFWIDGPWTTAFAAQPLAGENIMVLQVGEALSVTERDSLKEVQREVSAFEGAIDYLDQKRLIDRNLVGLVGFSRTCLYVKYALAHSNYHFSAASVTDGVDAGYLQYIGYSNSNPAVAPFAEGVNGGLPFGNGLMTWMRNSPAFNIDKVKTPLRIVAENTRVILAEWEWFACLFRLGRPVEMIAMRDGEHVLQKPWQRMISQQGNVDWFRFWLKGEEVPDPAKAEQYARWRELRKVQQENEKNSPALSRN